MNSHVGTVVLDWTAWRQGMLPSSVRRFAVLHDLIFSHYNLPSAYFSIEYVD